MLEAARAALPPDLLERISSANAARQSAGASGSAGAQQKSALRGRPFGLITGPRSGASKLDLIATLRAAAPWQRMRRDPPGVILPHRIRIRASDFRGKRFAERSETLTIFAVDASGSQVLHRLAETKGAVELLLADCYVRRDHVALIAFRGARAEQVLPPTRSLLRAKRSLSSLAGGGGTPMALGLDAAATLARAAMQRGRTPLIVLLTDGRGNIARNGSPDRAAAHDDTCASALAFRREGWAALLIDTSPQPAARAVRLAADMGATYLAMPYPGSASMTAAIKAARAEARTGRHG